MKLDLRRDLKELEDFILEKIRIYDEYENLGPGDDDDPIQRITLGYYVEQTGYVAVIFDTRPDATNDGEWTMHIEEDDNMVFVPGWEDAFNHLCDEVTVTVSLPNGKSRILDTKDDNESVATFFGEQICELVLGLKKRKIFDSLPLAKNAVLSVEDFNGLWAWPNSSKDQEQARLGS